MSGLFETSTGTLQTCGTSKYSKATTNQLTSQTPFRSNSSGSWNFGILTIWSRFGNLQKLKPNIRYGSIERSYDNKFQQYVLFVYIKCDGVYRENIGENAVVLSIEVSAIRMS